MSEASDLKKSKKAKITRRTSPEVRGKYVAQIPSKLKTRRRLPFVILDGDPEAEEYLVEPQRELKKRGPKPKYRGDILRFRDQLVMLLEHYWPELQKVCSTPVNRTRLLRILTAIDTTVRSESSEHLVRYMESLIELIVKKRVRNDPRQVANALAGVPNIGILTSLKHCANKENQCRIAIGRRAHRAYIERRHPRLARLLTLAKHEDTSAYGQALKDYDFRDRSIYLGRNKSKGLQEAWGAGVPDWKPLQLSGSKTPLV